MKNIFFIIMILLLIVPTLTAKENITLREQNNLEIEQLQKEDSLIKKIVKQELNETKNKLEEVELTPEIIEDNSDLILFFSVGIILFIIFILVLIWLGVN